MTLPETHTLAAHEKDGVVYYTFPAFDEIPFVRHGFSTRLGGVSEGVYASMNLPFTRGDEDERVGEIFRRFCGAIGVPAQQTVVSAQEHHTNLHVCTEADCGRGVTRERGYADIDGLLTDRAGVVLCTQYADCVPLFFVDPVRRAVATSHAGWRGTVARIGAVTVERMCREYGCKRENILAAVGPSIGPCCFEVDAPVQQAFAALDEADGCIRPAGEKFYIDLWAVNRRILEAAGVPVAHITVTDLCTRCHPDVFWSHRATGGQRGSLAGFIAMV